jgi:branched-chain amino acid aminotransferase
VVYLDAKTDTYLEEVSSCNIFVVKGKRIATPPLTGTILPGVTRRSIIELARSRGYEVEEVPVSVEEAMAADEVRGAAGRGGRAPATNVCEDRSHAGGVLGGLPT